MIDEALITMVRQIAPRFSLDPALICAIVEQESEGDTWLIRYEPAFYARYVAPMLLAGTIRAKPPLTVQTEATARAMSWGLMQVMGETAREAPVNYYGPLPGLCDPNTGISIGCAVFAAKYAKAKKNEQPENVQNAALLLWNGGANPQYDSEVLVRLGPYKSAIVTVS